VVATTSSEGSHFTAQEVNSAEVFQDCPTI
jgi:hypothetical protein